MRLCIGKADNERNVAVQLFKQSQTVLLLLDHDALVELQRLSSSFDSVTAGFEISLGDAISQPRSALAAAVNLASYLRAREPLDGLASLVKTGSLASSLAASAARSFVASSTAYEHDEGEQGMDHNELARQAKAACGALHANCPCMEIKTTGDVVECVCEALKTANRMHGERMLEAARSHFYLGLDSLLATHVLCVRLGMEPLEETCETLIRSATSLRPVRPQQKTSRSRKGSDNEQRSKGTKLELQRQLLTRQQWAEDPFVQRQLTVCPQRKRQGYGSSSRSARSQSSRQQAGQWSGVRSEDFPTEADVKRAKSQLRQYSRVMLAGVLSQRGGSSYDEESAEQVQHARAGNGPVTLSAALVSAE